MNDELLERKTLEPDRGQIESFIDAIFRHRGNEGCVSLRSFTHNDKPLWPWFAAPLKTATHQYLIDSAVDMARRAANSPEPAVFCPPLAVFKGTDGKNATEKDLLKGLVISVDCDAHPDEARAALEDILGPTTAIVRTGGLWTDPEDGSVHDKLHLHWRLAAPAANGELDKLKRARTLAAKIARADPSSNTTVHPLRWAGSWHTKEAPRLCNLVSVNPDTEVDLDEALAALEAAAPEEVAKTNGHDDGAEREHIDPLDWGALIAKIHEGKELHDSICRLAASFVNHGLPNKAAIEKLRSLMMASAAAKDPRWQARYDGIPRAVSSARKKYRELDSGVTSAAGITLGDFYAYAPQNNYIFAPTRDVWPAASVNARLKAPKGAGKVSASEWLAKNRSIEQITWAPGKPMLIKDSLIVDGAGWIKRPGCQVFNLYRPPIIVPKEGDVTPWLNLVLKVFPNDAKHITFYFAHRVQRPHEKINYALVIAGPPGIGKDTILEPVKQAIGPWNFAEESPGGVLGRFNGFLRSVILRVNEARDLGDFDRFAFYDHMKVYIAAPPDVLPVDEKNLKKYYIPNLCGVIITSNHKTDGIYLEPNDRRHFVAWSDLEQTDFTPNYWRKLYGWYANGGNEYVTHYLMNLDLTGFDPKAPPPKTQAFWEIVNANRPSEDAELDDILDALGSDLGRPNIVTVAEVTNKAAMTRATFAEYLLDRRNRPRIPHRFDECGYVAVLNPDDKGGRWKVNGVRHTLYGKKELTPIERLSMAKRWVEGKKDK